MGTDIHGVFQRRNETGTWEDVPHNYEMNRHYQLFAVLAGVRNGRGFAGVVTGEPVKPISEPRGYPFDPDNHHHDFDVDLDEDSHPISTLDHMDPRRQKWHEKGEPMQIWMGDHSHSWLTGAEMLAWYATAPEALQTGILSRAEYEAWDKVSQPGSYCGGVSGPGVVVINDSRVEMENTPDWTYVRCHWGSDLRKELAYFFDEVARLQREYGEIRFVFGFDS